MRIYLLPCFFLLHTMAMNTQVDIYTGQFIDNLKNTTELVFNMSKIKANEEFEQTADEIGTLIINKNGKYCNLLYYSDKKNR